MKPTDFDYELPRELIAQTAAEPRDSARLMVLNRADGSITHSVFRDLPDFLAAGDLLVLNDTRVVPARLFARRATGALVSILLLQELTQTDSAASPPLFHSGLLPQSPCPGVEEMPKQSLPRTCFGVRHDREVDFSAESQDLREPIREAVGDGTARPSQTENHTQRISARTGTGETPVLQCAARQESPPHELPPFRKGGISLESSTVVQDNPPLPKGGKRDQQPRPPTHACAITDTLTHARTPVRPDAGPLPHGRGSVPARQEPRPPDRVGSSVGIWSCLLQGRGRVKPGETLRLVAPQQGHDASPDSSARHVQHVRLLRRREDGVWEVQLTGGKVDEILDTFGFAPLPPYIKRAAGSDDRTTDLARYQTVYARHAGSIAAPTAGLHFTPGLFDRLETRGVRKTFITLHVGVGTFKPVTASRVEDHTMESERYSIDADTVERIGGFERRREKRILLRNSLSCHAELVSASPQPSDKGILNQVQNDGAGVLQQNQEGESAGPRLVAVGTTACRTLETFARRDRESPDEPLSGQSGAAGLFIYPPFQFRLVDALITNFHLPRGTPLMLTCAFAGRELVLRAYETAKKEGYRFYSYGDAMLIL